MSNSVSALNGKAHVDLVQITELGLRGMIALRGDLTAAKLQKAATKVVGVKFPAKGECNSAEDKGLAWMSPDEVLLMLPHEEALNAISIIETALKGTHFLAANVSDARAVIRLEGDHIREVIAKLSPVDMGPEAFRPGQFRRTRLAQIPAAFWMRDETTLHLICFRSVAGYAFDVLSRAAMVGTEVGAFTR